MGNTLAPRLMNGSSDVAVPLGALGGLAVFSQSDEPPAIPRMTPPPVPSNGQPEPPEEDDIFTKIAKKIQSGELSGEKMVKEVTKAIKRADKSGNLNRQSRPRHVSEEAIKRSSKARNPNESMIDDLINKARKDEIVRQGLRDKLDAEAGRPSPYLPEVAQPRNVSNIEQPVSKPNWTAEFSEPRSTYRGRPNTQGFDKEFSREQPLSKGGDLVKYAPKRGRATAKSVKKMSKPSTSGAKGSVLLNAIKNNKAATGIGALAGYQALKGLFEKSTPVEAAKFTPEQETQFLQDVDSGLYK